MVKNCFQWSFASDFQLQKAIVKGILECIKNEIPYLPKGDLFDLRVIINELTTNAIIHGHKMDVTKKVNLSVELDEKTITTIIRDEGAGFDYSQAANLSNDIFDEHGRGLQLVLNLADSVSWNNLGNEVAFNKNISRHNNAI